MTSLRIAFIPIIRRTFDVPFAEQMISEARASLVQAGFQLLEPDRPIDELSYAKEMAFQFFQA